MYVPKVHESKYLCKLNPDFNRKTLLQLTILSMACLKNSPYERQPRRYAGFHALPPSHRSRIAVIYLFCGMVLVVTAGMVAVSAVTIKVLAEAFEEFL